MTWFFERNNYSQMHVSWSCILMLTNPLLVFIRSKMIINCTTCSLSIQTRAIEVRFGPQSALYRANPMLFLWSIKSYYRACWDGWTENLPSGYNRGRLPRHTPPPLPLPTTSTQDVSYPSAHTTHNSKPVREPKQFNLNF